MREGAGVYKDKGKSYKLLLNFSEDDGVTGHAQGERTDTLAQGMESALPCQLYVLDQETGELAWEEFTEKVVSCKVDTKPGENSRKVDYVEPVHNESFPMQHMFLILFIPQTAVLTISCGT